MSKFEKLYLRLEAMPFGRRQHEIMHYLRSRMDRVNGHKVNGEIKMPRFGKFVGDWVRLGDGSRVHLGMLVYDIADERHHGKIVAVKNSAFADIRWEETGYRSQDIPLRDLRKV